MNRRPSKPCYLIGFLILALSPLGRFLVPDVAPATSPVQKLQEFDLDQVHIRTTDSYHHNLFPHLHFGLNTFDGIEYGDPALDAPSLFNFANLHAGEWSQHRRKPGFGR